MNGTRVRKWISDRCGDAATTFRAAILQMVASERRHGYNQEQYVRVQEVKDLLRGATGFDAWTLMERHAIMGAKRMNGIGLSFFTHTKYRSET